MTRRLGTFLHRLGLLLAVLAIGGALVWNASTFQQRKEAQENLRNLSPIMEERQAALAEAFARQRASTKNLKRSLTIGGALILAGLAVYGLGWSAQYIARGPRRRRYRR